MSREKTERNKEIRAAYAKGDVSMTRLGELYGLDSGTISRIINKTKRTPTILKNTYGRPYKLGIASRVVGRFNMGFTVDELSKLFGLSENVIELILKEAGRV